jgi:hypothetical protein
MTSSFLTGLPGIQQHQVNAYYDAVYHFSDISHTKRSKIISNPLTAIPVA